MFPTKLTNIYYHFIDAVPVKGGVFPAGSGDILLDDLLCQGDEENLLFCEKFPGSHTCNHSEDAGVICECNSMLTLY